jgi:ATP-dependent DNA ligase
MTNQPLFLLDGEAIVTNERGLAVFDLIRHKRHGDDALLIAFDLIELDGEDLRRTPIEQHKRTELVGERIGLFAESFDFLVVLILVGSLHLIVDLV